MEQVISFTPYGIHVALSLLAGLVASGIYLKHARRFSLEVLLCYSICTVPCVWFVSRFVFVLANCTYYITTLSNPLLALRFWDGGYSMAGAFMGACAGALIAGIMMRISSLVLLDGTAIGFPVAVIFARLSETGTGLGEGRPVTGFIPPLAPEGYDSYLHPVFLYEAVCAFLIVLILIGLICSHHMLVHEGDLLLLEMVLYGITQVLLESLKDDGHMVVHFVRIQQVLAICLVVFSMVIFARRIHVHKRSVWVCFTITGTAIALAVLAEFGVDRWGNRPLAYGLLIFSLLCVFLSAIHLYHLTFREVLHHGTREN